MANTESKRYRIQLDLSQRTFDQLDRLQTRLDAGSRAAVIRKALNHLETTISYIDEGTEIKIKRPDQEDFHIVEYPLLQK